MWATAFFGAVATLAALWAAQDCRRIPGAGRAVWPVRGFWIVVAVYMAAFTILRAAGALGATDQVLRAIFYVQTLGGASTLVFLLYIFVGVTFGRRWARVGFEIGLVAAVAIVTLIFSDGLIGPFWNHWGVEFLPANEMARWSIAFAYVATPAAFSGLAYRAMARSDDQALKLRAGLFCSSVVLMFVPNAVKYVVVIPGMAGLTFAAVMSMGTILGWRSYHVGTAAETGAAAAMPAATAATDEGA